MPIEKWSDQISIARLASDPHFNDEMQTLQEQALTRRLKVIGI